MAANRNVRRGERGRKRFASPSANAAFHWHQDEKILVEISRKFEPHRLQEQLGFFDLRPVDHYTDPQEWFSVLLFRKRG